MPTGQVLARLPDNLIDIVYKTDLNIDLLNMVIAIPIPRLCLSGDEKSADA